MSAAGTREKLRTACGVREVAMTYLSIDMTEAEASRFTFNPHPKTARGGWMGSSDTTSAGPICYLKNRMAEERFVVGVGMAEDDDILPIVYVTRGRHEVATICNVARSRMFRTPLVVYPIDLIAGRVAGLANCLFAEAKR
jgi:hypothetical protein